MFRNREEMRRRLFEIIDKFRQKGATSAEKALTIEELGLPQRFEEAMHRRLGQSGIFVEVNGKYYLNEERLKQIQEQRAQGGGLNRTRGQPSWYRFIGILLMLPLGLIAVFVIFYLTSSGGGYFPGEFLIAWIVIFIVLTAIRLLFWRSRRRNWRDNQNSL